jgi:hypothetical protein
VKLRNREEYWQGRTARKRHRCESECRARDCVSSIGPRSQYVEITLPPGGEIGYQDWCRMKICRPCAADFNADLTARLFTP